MLESLTSCLTWPFVTVWRLVTAILEITGRLIAIGLGVVLTIVGVLLSLTVVGATIGIPMLLLGIMLIGRGLF